MKVLVQTRDACCWLVFESKIGAIERLTGKRDHMRTFRTLLVFLALAIPAVLFGKVNVSISIGPPPLPVYEQPICPGDG